MLALLANLLSKVVPLLGGFNLSGILGGLGTGLQALGKNVITNWKAWLIGLLILLQVGTGYGFYHEHDQYVKEKMSHQADIQKFVAAQKAADDAVQNEKNQLQTESKAAKHEADANYSALLAKYNASLLRYATSKGHPTSSSNNQLPAAEGFDGPGADPNLPTAVNSLPSQINITGSDAEICAVNTARLQSAHDWAIQQLQMEKQNDGSQTVQSSR